MAIKLTGVFPALTTPFVNGEIALEKFEQNIKRFNTYDLSGYLVLGSTGESILLSDEEKLELIKCASKASGENKFVIAGTGEQTTKKTIELTNKAAKNGAAAALILTPFYYKGQMTPNVLYDFFKEVADNSEIPILLYNVPKYTGVVIPTDIVAKLSTHNNIIGIKDSSGDLSYFAELVKICQFDFIKLTGSGSVFYPALTLGGDGGILAIANFAVADCVKMYISYMNNDLEYAKKIQLKLNPVNRRIVGQLGVAGIKHAVDLVGFYGGKPRKPLLESDEIIKSEIEKLLKNAEIIA